MGLLDDAIREHLDLKRRRGADPSEIAREESEALGPVRRGEPADDAGEVPDAERPYADEPAGRAEVALDEPGLDDDYAFEAPPAPAPYDDVEDRLVRSDEPRTHADPYAEREDETATPPHGDPLAHQQTREFSAHELDEALGQPAEAERAPEAPHADEPDPDADELEETPDFLQETPEHDRLWFEQKPPKDFDF